MHRRNISIRLTIDRDNTNDQFAYLVKRIQDLETSVMDMASQLTIVHTKLFFSSHGQRMSEVSENNPLDGLVGQ
jgi:hypothetical protein